MSAEYVRIVRLHRGKLKPAEFRLRPGERGLSMFRRLTSPSPAEVLEAVRGAGKQGDLVAVVVPASELARLGLTVTATPGGTPVAAVNAVHVEARLPFWRAWLFRLRGVAADEYFNERFSGPIHAAARVLEGESEL
ncbi:MAG: hypothetical protein U0746_07975 [Gemmataceae bacterium]